MILRVLVKELVNLALFFDSLLSNKSSKNDSLFEINFVTGLKFAFNELVSICTYPDLHLYDDMALDVNEQEMKYTFEQDEECNA